MAITARLIVPTSANPGDVLPIEASLHRGEAVRPERAITSFYCRYNDSVIFRADWHAAEAAEQRLQFHALAEASGPLEFIWIDRAGTEYRAVTTITVS